MELSFLLKGMIIGFSIAAQLGPAGILCIRHSLTKSKFSGLITGMGAATADGIYGTIAAFGLTLISSFLIDIQSWIKIFGMLFLFYLGIKAFIEKPKKTKIIESKNKFFLSDYLSTLLITLANPMTILSFIMIFAGAGLVEISGSYINSSLIALGVFSGSTIWWIILSNATGLLRNKITPKILTWINRISGSILIIFALGLLVSLLNNWL